MKKFVIFAISFILFSTGCIFALTNTSDDFDTYKCRLFSLSIPKELKGTYEIKKEKDKISVYHKESELAGFGGFAFGIKAYKNPAEHAMLPGGKKIGELEVKNIFGRKSLYDIVLKYPTDVQYDYTKGPNPPDSYKQLYDYGEKVGIQGVKGSVYNKAQGTKGEDLYNEILIKHITAINEKWDSIKLEQENMSPMYNVISSSGKNVLDKIGYTYYDTNADGIDELIIGEIAYGEWEGIIYDMYTMVDRKPQHVMSGWSRNRYFVCDNAFICNDYSGGANESGKRVYILVENSTELFPQVSFKYDGYTNPKKPWFMSYGNGADEDKWENVTEETFNERKQVFEKYERFDFTPLSKLSALSN